MTAAPFDVLAPVKKATSSIVRHRTNTFNSQNVKDSQHDDDIEDDKTKTGATPLHPDVAMERTYYFDQWLRGRDREYYYKEGKTTFPGNRNWTWPTPTVGEVEKAPSYYPKSVESDDDVSPLKLKTSTNWISRHGDDGQKEVAPTNRARSDSNMSPASGSLLSLVTEEEEIHEESDSLYSLPAHNSSPTASNNAFDETNISPSSAPIPVANHNKFSRVPRGSDATTTTEASVISDESVLSRHSELGHTTKTKLQCDFSAYPDPDFIAPEQTDKDDKASYFLRMAMGGNQARLVRDEMERRQELDKAPVVKRVRQTAKERWRSAIGKVMGRKREEVKVAPSVLVTVPPVPGLFPTCQHEVLQAIDGHENGRGRCNYTGPTVIPPRKMFDPAMEGTEKSRDGCAYRYWFNPGIQ
ncbi:MAG: hypothetical protein M1831_003358 [Alyxoria varia]|nr:MAG: hypothetical protein M1831_003358 [Alyxoria varia]